MRQSLVLLLMSDHNKLPESMQQFARSKNTIGQSACRLEEVLRTECDEQSGSGFRTKSHGIKHRRTRNSYNIMLFTRVL